MQSDDAHLHRFRDEVMPIADRLFRLALSLVGARQEAEDVVQDTMLRLWEKRDAWNTIKNIEAWCIASVRNASIDCTRTRHTHDTLPDDDNRPSATPTPHEHLVAAEGRDNATRILEGLPELQRSIFVLREVECKSYAEIASLLNISDAQVKTYLLRARRHLREQFVKIS